MKDDFYPLKITAVISDDGPDGFSFAMAQGHLIIIDVFHEKTYENIIDKNPKFFNKLLDQLHYFAKNRDIFATLTRFDQEPNDFDIKNLNFQELKQILKECLYAEYCFSIGIATQKQFETSNKLKELINHALIRLP